MIALKEILSKIEKKNILYFFINILIFPTKSRTIQFRTRVISAFVMKTSADPLD